MRLWRQSTALLVILLFTLALGGPTSSKHESSHLSRRHEAESKQGLLAGPMFLALSSMFFPVLPLVMMAPLAIAGLGPAVSYLTDAIASATTSSSSSTNNQQHQNQAISEVLQSLTASNAGLSSALAQLAQKQQSQQSTGQSSSLSSSASSSASATGAAASSSNSAVSSIKKISQALGLSEASVGDQETSSSLISSLFDDSDKKFSGSSILNNLAGGTFGNRPILVPPSKGKPPSSATAADFLGAAAAALDNAGLLGPIAGVGTGSVTGQLLNLVTGKGGSAAAAASSPAASAASPAASTASASASPSTSALTELLGLASDSSASTSAVSSIAASPATYTGSGKPSQLPVSTSSVSSMLNMASSSNSGSLQRLANNAINRISDFIFSKRRSSSNVHAYPSFVFGDAVSAKSKAGVFSYVKDVFSTLKDGVRRYEISESECQARLMCELNQKAVGRSFKSWANSLFDLFNVEDALEKSTFTARTKSTAKEMLRAARDGMNEKDCATLYARCPINMAEIAKQHIASIQQQQQQQQYQYQQVQPEMKAAATVKAKEMKSKSSNVPEQQISTVRPTSAPLHKPIAVVLQANKVEAHPTYHNINSVASSASKPIVYNQYKS